MLKKKIGSPRIAWRVIVVMLIACLAINGAVYWVLNVVADEVRRLAAAHLELADLQNWASRIEIFNDAFWPYFVPATVVFFGLLSLLLWLMMRRLVRRATTAVQPQKSSKALKSDKPAVSQAQIDRQAAELNQRFFLHLFGVLQREGRLMDFLAEDLSLYQDAQIGAAVRNIHDDCKKAVDKYLAPRPVLDKGEGEQMIVPAGFDPNLLKLTGNVTGQPPFKAVIRHRGWRAVKLDLPTLAGRQEPGLIAPAELEVV